MHTQRELSSSKTKIADGVFLPRLFDETMALLTETRNYFFAKSSLDQQMLNHAAKLVYSAEMSRITLRLSSVMAWVLARRAVHAGEITTEELKAMFPLQCIETCTFDTPHIDRVLPRAVCDLLTRTRSLYERIHRLETLET